MVTEMAVPELRNPVAPVGEAVVFIDRVPMSRSPASSDGRRRGAGTARFSLGVTIHPDRSPVIQLGDVVDSTRPVQETLMHERQPDEESTGDDDPPMGPEPAVTGSERQGERHQNHRQSRR